jgi:hypothetical protein
MLNENALRLLQIMGRRGSWTSDLLFERSALPFPELQRAPAPGARTNRRYSPRRENRKGSVSRLAGCRFLASNAPVLSRSHSRANAGAARFFCGLVELASSPSGAMVSRMDATAWGLEAAWASATNAGGWGLRGRR